jgi:hypothetical protein
MKGSMAVVKELMMIDKTMVIEAKTKVGNISLHQPLAASSQQLNKVYNFNRRTFVADNRVDCIAHGRRWWTQIYSQAVN